jgi:hypothetical protein
MCSAVQNQGVNAFGTIVMYNITKYTFGTNEINLLPLFASKFSDTSHTVWRLLVCEDYHEYELIQTGFVLVKGFIEHLQIVIPSNYSVIAHPHTLQSTTARSKSSESALSSPVIAWLWIPTISSHSLLNFLSTGDRPTTDYTLDFSSL